MVLAVADGSALRTASWGGGHGVVWMVGSLRFLSRRRSRAAEPASPLGRLRVVADEGPQGAPGRAVVHLLGALLQGCAQASRARVACLSACQAVPRMRSASASASRVICRACSVAASIVWRARSEASCRIVSAVL